MNSREAFVWVVGLLALLVFATSPVTCTMHRHRVIAQAIKAGADPIEAKCAIEGDNGTSAMCAAAMQQRAVRLRGEQP